METVEVSGSHYLNNETNSGAMARISLYVRGASFPPSLPTLRGQMPNLRSLLLASSFQFSHYYRANCWSMGLLLTVLVWIANMPAQINVARSAHADVHELTT